MSKQPLLKDQLNQESLKSISQDLKKQHSKFDINKFMTVLLSAEFKNSELKQKIKITARAINACLKVDYSTQIHILIQIAPNHSGLKSLIFPQFVEFYGLESIEDKNNEKFKISLAALKILTQYGTSEFALRPFFLKNSNLVLKSALKWSKDKNFHVRRLSSEGLRPRLPWSFRLDLIEKDPELVRPILENLMNDDSLYVRKSVANHLNDLSKKNEKWVIEFAKKWINKSEFSNWILKHGLRTLLKKGHQEALSLFKLSHNKNIQNLKLNMRNSKIKIESELEFAFSFENVSAKPQNLRLEYCLHFLRSNGQHKPKVFKITERMFNTGNHTIQKKHSFKSLTTRKHYPGQHKVEIKVNGVVYAEQIIWLT